MAAERLPSQVKESIKTLNREVAKLLRAHRATKGRKKRNSQLWRLQCGQQHNLLVIQKQLKVLSDRIQIGI